MHRLALLLVLLCACPGWTASLELSLPLALRIALHNSMEAKIAAHRITQSRYDLAGAGKTFAIKPFLSADTYLYGPDNPARTGKIGLGATKKFPFGTDLSLVVATSVYGNQAATLGSDPAWKSGITLTLSQPLLQGAGAAFLKYGINTARWTVREKQIAFAAEVSRIVRDTELAFWQHLHAQRREKIAGISLQLARQLLEMNTLQVKLGLLPQTDLIEARSVVATREEEVLKAANEVNGTRDDLLALLHLEKKNITNVLFLTQPATPKPVGNMSDLVASALTNSPDIRLLEASHGRNTLAIAYWKNLSRPELNLDLNLGTDGQDSRFAPSLGPSQFSFSLGLRLALPWGSDAPDNLKSAELEKKILDLRLAGLQRDTANRVRAAIRNINNAASRIAAADKARDLARQRMDLMTQKLNLKLASNTDVLQAQRDYLEAILAYETAVLTYSEESVKLQYECGLNLRAHNITLEPEKQGAGK